MFFTKCPDCQGSVEVVDESVAWIRCPQCGHKISLRESDEEREERVKRASKAAAREVEKKKGPPPSIWMELLPILIAVPISLLFLLITCLLPPFVVMTAITALGISTFGFVMGCYIASHDGNWVSFDYLGLFASAVGVMLPVFIALHIILLPLALLLWSLHVQGFVLLWEAVLIGCAIKEPRKYLPWIGLQAYGLIVLIAGGVMAAIGSAIGSWID